MRVFHVGTIDTGESFEEPIQIVEGIVLECEAKNLNLTLPAVDVLHLLNSTNFITFVMLYPIIMDWNLLTDVEWQLSV